MFRKSIFGVGSLVLLLVSCVYQSPDRQLRADMVDILVPAYSNPANQDGSQMWNQLIATAGDGQRHFQLHAIFNPASGPGTSRDGNYLDGSGNGPLADFRAAGGVTHGYVATGFGTRDLSLVYADIDAYLTGHYQGYVDGLFFDEMSNDLQHVGYYQQIAQYVNGVQSGLRTFGNPGTTFTTNPTNQTDYSAEDYVQVFDTLMTFENTGQEYSSNYTDPAYLAGQPASRFAHVLHTQDSWDSSLVALAAQRKAGMLYVTDDVMNNPYDQLTSYWSQFTADVSAYNSVPEPGQAMVLGWLVLASVAGRRRQRGAA